MDQLHGAGIPFMLSYVIEHKGRVNQNLLRWIKRGHYRVIRLGEILEFPGAAERRF